MSDIQRLIKEYESVVKVKDYNVYIRTDLQGCWDERYFTKDALISHAKELNEIDENEDKVKTITDAIQQLQWREFNIIKTRYNILTDNEKLKIE